MENKNIVLNRLRDNSERISIFVFFAGCMVLVGWIFNISYLKEVIPGLQSMKANNTIVFMLLALSLWLLQQKRLNDKNIKLAKFFAVVVTLIGVITFLEYFLKINLLFHKGVKFR